ncbi:hypothetical protein A6R68_22335, partial [Neotoma lepida]
VKEKSGNSKSVLKESNSVEESKHADGPKKGSLNKDTVLEKHLKTVENVAWKNGLAPEAIDILLSVALSGKFGNAINTRILKCMIPETLISEDSVVKAVSWLCVDKCSSNTKILFYRWLVAMFDFIDHKKQINLLYGFFFTSLQEDALVIKPFRVRKLLDLQAKMGMQPHLQALLSLYKFFAPALISVSLPVRRKKWSSHSVIPTLNSANKACGEKKMSLSDYLSSDRSLPLEQLQSFPQLLQNIHCLECSVLQSLKELLQNWLLWLSMDAHVQPMTNSPLETTLGGSMSSVSQLIDYVGWLSMIAMRLESNSALLLHFILDFYEKAQSEFNLNSKICQEFNYYLTVMVHCLWMSKPFEKGVYIDPQILENTDVTEYKNSLNLVHHPSLLSYAASFLLQ